MRKLAYLLSLTMGFMLSFAVIASPDDLDNDGVKNWEDYCPNTPPNKPVWTSEKLKGTSYGLNWCGCGGKGVDEPVPGFEPYRSIQISVGARGEESRPTVKNGLSQLSQNLVISLRKMAKSSVRPKAVVYERAATLLEDHEENYSISGLVGSLCEKREMIRVLLPLIESTSSKIFSDVITRAKKLSVLLNQTTGTGCRILGSDKSRKSLATFLTLSQAGWNGLTIIGYSEEMVAPISELKLKLGVALSGLHGAEFQIALKGYLDGFEAVESFLSQHTELGLGQFLITLKEELESFQNWIPPVESEHKFELGEGVALFLSPALIAHSNLFSHEKPSGVLLGEDAGLGPYFQFMRIEPGRFWMGSPSSESGRESNEDYHEVILTEPYEIQTTELTQEVYQRFMHMDTSKLRSNQGPNLPVHSISALEAYELLKKINDWAENTPYQYGLPTEAQWEYAARAGVDWIKRTVDDFAWYVQNSKGEMHPVGFKKPNPWGLYDVLGNVHEMTSDRYAKSLGGREPALNPKIDIGDVFVIKGGSYYSSWYNVRLAYRKTLYSDDLEYTGIRLIRWRKHEKP